LTLEILTNTRPHLQKTLRRYITLKADIEHVELEMTKGEAV